MTLTQLKKPRKAKATARRGEWVWIKTRLSTLRKLGGSDSYSQHGHPGKTAGSSTELDPFILLSPTDDHPPTKDAFNGEPSPPVTPKRPPPEPRPSIPSSSKSAPALLQHDPIGDADSPLYRKREKANKLSLLDVDQNIMNKLEPQFTKNQGGAVDGGGYVYLLKVTPKNEPHKIIRKLGHTDRTVKERASEIKNMCHHDVADPEEDPEDRLIAFSHRAEKLAQTELTKRLYQFTCACGKAHKEYFDVEKDVALEIIRRWRTFCGLRPYDAHGKLLPFWNHRLQHHKNGREKFYDSHQTLSEAEQLRLRWGRFSSVSKFPSVSKLRILFFNIANDSADIWPVVALFEAVAIALCTSRPLFVMALVILATIAMWRMGWKLPGLSTRVMYWMSAF
ncbi:hypothetical protein O1611_g8586 [Lasiodiplodia mahajangana]|uniref:Uncharacterized protein n=1 Tax=Lasiodiplodia mahajangana TaxID=1108764 RepID=A0ACC2JCA9_9PEZI|nr:hypothetical protein O1611_g8586 [Lasiodiplodia mahajangana]